jgi:two-component system, NtrC family, response regulator AtoC
VKEFPVFDHVTESARILVVSNERSTLSRLWILGDANGWQLETAGNGWEALERVQSGTGPDAILLDLPQGDSDGLHTLRWLRRVRPDLPVVVLSHRDDDGRKTEATRLGANEYLMRPLAEEQLETAIRRCLSGDSEGAADSLAEGIEQIAEDMFFVAAGASMRKLRAQAELLAQVNSPLLIVGERGSGKELAARLIHKLSVRSGSRFLKLNCAALPGEVLESELFGYDRAFAGNGHGPSKFELCQQGTLYLEEITEMPMSLQAKLLHAFQEGQLVKGDGQNRSGIDVRILAGTSLSIEQAIAENKLREDLYYRLSAFTLHVPPLRRRREEIPLLLGHFMNQLARRYSLPAPTIAPRMLEACQLYDWPDNLRELQDFVKRQLANGGQGPMPGAIETEAGGVDKARLSPVIQETGERSIEGHDGESGSGLKSLLQSVKGEAEKNAIASALEQTRWNRKAAARLLKVSYRTLLYKIQQYHMSPPGYLSPVLIHQPLKDGHVR